jgi:bacillithiol synthase
LWLASSPTTLSIIIININKTKRKLIYNKEFSGSHSLSIFTTTMDCTAQRIPYRQTGKFTNIVLDYLDHAANLKPFYAHAPTLQGLQKAIDARKKFNTNREILVQELKKQYATVSPSIPVQKNIESLLSENTFTVTTAHQPNIFTGPLYFIYKILHTIKLAEHLAASFKEYKFVPVFYMGSEDADLDELGHIYLDGEKISWNTKQTGAVGRMKIDKELIKLIDRISGRVLVEPNGAEIIQLVKESYTEGAQIQDATFKFVNSLFAEYGLLVLIPDNATLKNQMLKIFEDDLNNQTASGIVEKTAQQLQAAGYKAQAHPREINLFYLKDNLRGRIEKTKDKFIVHNSSLTFSEKEMQDELKNHPERFSPNVILRGLYQETILPNIAFIGGGGETAYWLELKDLFDHYLVPFPALILRNSFLAIENKWQDKMNKLGFAAEDFFQPVDALVNKLVKRETANELKLNGVFEETNLLYEQLKKKAAPVDSTLTKHIDALKAKSIHRLQELEKKMMRAEKRKFIDQQRQIATVKENLFPKNGLQERIDNIIPYYAKYGSSFIQQLYKRSLSLEQEFVILSEK